MLGTYQEQGVGFVFSFAQEAETGEELVPGYKFSKPTPQ